MLARKTCLALLPKPYYRTYVQRHIRCCSVLQAIQGKKESSFQLPEKWKAKQIALENKFRYRFPYTAELVFRVRDGFVGLFSDIKNMTKLQIGVVRGSTDVHALNLQELDLLHETSLQIRKVFPALAIFAIPFIGNFIVVFLAYIKPLRFLSPHFWTDQQKATHVKETHANRASVFLPIVQYLEMNSFQGMKSASKLRNIMESVQRGFAPNLKELAACRELFCGEKIFSLNGLPASQLGNLMKLHGQRSLVFKLFYLREWGSYIILVDRYIRQNGGASKLTFEQLRKYCFQRGVNANVMSEKEMRDFMNQWITFTEPISDKDYVSLVLHAPAIVGFSHKSNIKVTDES